MNTGPQLRATGPLPMPESPELGRKRREPSEEEKDSALGTITSERTPLLGLTATTEDPGELLSISPISPFVPPHPFIHI